jgi:hypothetical protein
MLSFRWISSHRYSLLLERSLKRGQLPSFSYLTWLSLPFQCFSFIVVFATYSCSFGTGIYALSLCRNLNDLKGVFLWTAGGKRAGGLHHPGQGMQDTDGDFAALSNSEPLPAGIGRTDGIPRTFSCCNFTFRSTETFLTYYPWEIKPDYRVDPTVSLYQIVQLPHYADRGFPDICPFHTVPAQSGGQ